MSDVETSDSSQVAAKNDEKRCHSRSTSGLRKHDFPFFLSPGWNMKVGGMKHCLERKDVVKKQR